MATRSSILYFVVADLAQVDPMYQYSLDYFKKLFSAVIQTAPQQTDFQEHLQTLTRLITEVRGGRRDSGAQCSQGLGRRAGGGSGHDMAGDGGVGYVHRDAGMALGRYPGPPLRPPHRPQPYISGPSGLLSAFIVMANADSHRNDGRRGGGSMRMAVHRRRTPPPPDTPSLPDQRDHRVKKAKFTIGKMLSGHVWYTNFWVPDPPPPQASF